MHRGTHDPRPWCGALLVALLFPAAATLAETRVVSFDEGTIPADLECNETWVEDGLELRIVPLDQQVCGLSLCTFTHGDGALNLVPGQLRVDLASIPGPVDHIDVTLGTVCIDCVPLSAYDGDVLVATTTNGNITFPTGTVTLDVGGQHVDRLEINPCFELLLDAIVVEFEPGAASVDAMELAPATARLAVHPSPFNPSTVVHLTLDRASRASVGVYDARGRQVRRLLDDRLDAGEHRIAWNGRTDDGRVAAAGAYFVQLRLDGVVVATRKAILVP